MQQQALHRVPYQGYPYSSPPVSDAPTVEAGAGARWAHLPRRQVEPPVKRIEPRNLNKQHGVGTSAAVPRKPAPAEEPEPAPVVYIDMPEAGSAVYTLSGPADDDGDDSSPAQNQRVAKRDPTDEPVVYVEMPDTGASELTTHSEERTREPEYVQETIFFNPFESGPLHHKQTDTDSEEDSPSTSPHPHPTTLHLHQAGPSGAGTSELAASSSSLVSKQTMVYGDTFPMSPIPVSEFPEPPPSYAEIDRVSSPVVEPRGEAVTEQPRPLEPPRTQVILPRDAAHSPVGSFNSERKYLNCHHCGLRVHSLVIRENGTITHFIALICLLICMLPCVLFIYCSETLKIKNHYCPSCNKVIGYQLPFGKKIVYVN